MDAAAPSQLGGCMAPQDLLRLAAFTHMHACHPLRIMYKLGRPEEETNGLLTAEDKAELDATTLVELIASFRALNNSSSGTCFSKGSSAYRGVYWNKSKGKWVARIQVPGVGLVHLGYFVDEEDAARAYDQAALYLHGR
jgi:hypothetical protein